ncbi:hypothetical protein CHUAL_013642 [Chamberlinius hualienensis]
MDNIRESQTLYDYKFLVPQTEINAKLGPGKLQFPFSASLPVNLPSSLESKFGHVRYTCSSNIARPKKLDPKCKCRLRVIELVDINRIPNYDVPITQEQFQNVGNDNGSITSKLHLFRRGYVPKDEIKFSVDICNHSTETIPFSTISLISVFSYKAGNYKTIAEEEIRSYSLGKIDLKSDLHFDDLTLTVPPIPPSIPEDGYRLITVNYFIQLKLTVNSKDMKTVVPITVGAVRQQDELIVV